MYSTVQLMVSQTFGNLVFKSEFLGFSFETCLPVGGVGCLASNPLLLPPYLTEPWFCSGMACPDQELNRLGSKPLTAISVPALDSLALGCQIKGGLYTPIKILKNYTPIIIKTVRKEVIQRISRHTVSVSWKGGCIRHFSRSTPVHLASPPPLAISVDISYLQDSTSFLLPWGGSQLPNRHPVLDASPLTWTASPAPELISSLQPLPLPQHILHVTARVSC